MCEKYEVNFNDRLHLIFNSHAKSFKECQCWVNKGKFSLIIMDLRLNMRNKDQCADTKMVINKDHYLCNASSDSYGAIFGETFKFNADLPPDALIALVSDSSTPPEMVWIELIPEGNICFIKA